MWDFFLRDINTENRLILSVLTRIVIFLITFHNEDKIPHLSENKWARNVHIWNFFPTTNRWNSCHGATMTTSFSFFFLFSHRPLHISNGCWSHGNPWDVTSSEGGDWWKITSDRCPESGTELSPLPKIMESTIIKHIERKSLPGNVLFCQYLASWPWALAQFPLFNFTWLNFIFL